MTLLPFCCPCFLPVQWQAKIAFFADFKSPRNMVHFLYWVQWKIWKSSFNFLLETCPLWPYPITTPTTISTPNPRYTSPSCRVHTFTVISARVTCACYPHPQALSVLAKLFGTQYVEHIILSCNGNDRLESCCRLSFVFLYTCIYIWWFSRPPDWLKDHAY